MNHNEKDRIAAAIHALRPDWPIKSLRTILDDPKLTEKPRRDVAVALTWVACDASSSTPARVHEAGPWWKATNVEGDGEVGRPTPPKPIEACSTCGKRNDQAHPQDHPFVPLRLARQYRVAPPGDLVREAIHEANGDCCACGTLAIHCPTHGGRAGRQHEAAKETAHG